MTRLTRATALNFYLNTPTAELGRMADQVRRAKHPEGHVTYIIDRNVNYTNVCVERCTFCAFRSDLRDTRLFKDVADTVAGAEKTLAKAIEEVV